MMSGSHFGKVAFNTKVLTLRLVLKLVRVDCGSDVLVPDIRENRLGEFMVRAMVLEEEFVE